jgi:sec-independent protein translocase protein TatC
VESDKSLISSDLKLQFAKYSHFLNEFRHKLFITFCVFIVSTFLGFTTYEKIIKFLVEILSLSGINIVFTSPFQFINLAISCGVTIGIIVVIPLIIIQILFFLKPALKASEFKALIWFLPFSIILFAMGFLFGFLIMKWQIHIFLDRSVAIGIGNILDISRLLNVVLLTSCLMGLGFQFPVILLLLMRLGFLNHNDLARQRRWVYLGSFLFAILLPPDSILADILLSLPLAILFEFTLILNKILGKSTREVKL